MRCCCCFCDFVQEGMLCNGCASYSVSATVLPYCDATDIAWVTGSRIEARENHVDTLALFQLRKMAYCSTSPTSTHQSCELVEVRPRQTLPLSLSLSLSCALLLLLSHIGSHCIRMRQGWPYRVGTWPNLEQQVPDRDDMMRMVLQGYTGLHLFSHVR